MTTWYAQNSNVNIDSVNEWNDVPDGSGNWLTWADLAPADILVTNGKTSIAINVNYICNETTNEARGGTAGGTMIFHGGVHVVSDFSGGGNLISQGGPAGDRYITGNLTTTITGTLINSTLNHRWWIVGNIACRANGIVLHCNTQLFATIVGDISADAFFGLGGSSVTMKASTSASDMDIHITGNVTNTGESGTIDMNSRGTLEIVGDIIASGNRPPVSVIGGTSLLKHSGNQIAATNGMPAVVLGAISNSAKIQIADGGTLIHEYRNYSNLPRRLYTGGINLGQPVESDVRLGTTFGDTDEYTGTLAVPDPQYVNAGVPTDNTVGTLTAGLDESALHAALDAYTNKADWKATGFATINPDNAGIREAAVNAGIAAREWLD